MKGNLPTFTLRPAALAFASVSRRCDLRHGSRCSRDVRDVERVHALHAGDLLDADHALVAGLVREPGRAGQIADGIDARLAGRAVAVGHDMRALDLHLGALEADILDIADDADGRDHAVGGDLLVLPPASTVAVTLSAPFLSPSPRRRS
jgi:hypothetical protein